MIPASQSVTIGQQAVPTLDDLSSPRRLVLDISVFLICVTG